MPISGIVIQVEPDQRDTVIASLVQIEGVELPETPDGAMLVAVIDAASIREEEALFKQITDLPGVQNVTLSYHNFEDLDAQQVN